MSTIISNEVSTNKVSKLETLHRRNLKKLLNTRNDLKDALHAITNELLDSKDIAPQSDFDEKLDSEIHQHGLYAITELFNSIDSINKSIGSYYTYVY